MGAKNSGIAREGRIIPLCNGSRTSSEIAEILGENMKYVQRIMLKHNAPRLAQAPRTGIHNPSYRSGRKIDRDGYVLVSAEPGHPYARRRAGRQFGIIYEHRLIVEKNIGRFLLPGEVVDHVDGLRLHNSPSNLRLFENNATHLKQTISGMLPKWSESGFSNMRTKHVADGENQRVHKYVEMKKSGDARLRQILLAMLSLEPDSPYLLGTSHHLEKAGISDFSHSNLKRVLGDLFRKYA